MADNKKYYYLKLKEDFFESDELKILQSMPDGYLYSDILLKLYLKSLRNNGKLMYRDVIPYTSSIIAALTGHQVGTVEKAVDTFQKLGLVEVLDNGAIFLLDIQNFIGQSSTEADRQREYYKTIKEEKLRIAEEKNKKSCKKSNKKSCEELSKKSCEKSVLEIKSIENRDKSIYTVSKDTVRRSDDQLDDVSQSDNHQPDVKSSDIEQVITAWNNLGLSQISKITAASKRGQGLKARIREYGLDKVLEAIDNISHSTFLRGGNKTGWTITLDWLVKPNNFPKVLENQYVDKAGDNSETRASPATNSYIESIKNRLDVVDQW